MLTAKAILTPKLTSYPFEDRLLILDVPAKIGRSHKDEGATSNNGYFDCKVLSRQHAMILYENERFFIFDSGSSNGSFVNNIRLSKAGEESKFTEIFTNDILRFGSDVIDKSRQVTQKAIVAKVRLYNPDGTEVGVRPSSSRLFRPHDSMEDLHAVTQTLQESLSREKMLEEKLVKVKTMIGKNIGKSHTDLLRLFENIKEELMNLYSERSQLCIEKETYEKITAENLDLTKQIKEFERLLEERDQCYLNVQKRQQADALENMALKKACQLQKTEIDKYEMSYTQLEEELNNLKTDCEVKYKTKIEECEKNRLEIEDKYEEELKKQEIIFTEERTRLREQMKVIAGNEANLLNRIKSLENNENYERAELDRVLNKEREDEETRRGLMYQIEILRHDLKKAHDSIEEHESRQNVCERDPEDISKIKGQEEAIAKLNKELAYFKQELVDARAHKAASDDELSTIRGQIETFENTIDSLSGESTRMRKTVQTLEDNLGEASTENTRLRNLVTNMENSQNQEEMFMVQIDDLRKELAKAETNLKQKNAEAMEALKECRKKDEIIQQKEIELSCVNGQIQDMQDEISGHSKDSVTRKALEKENSNLSIKISTLTSKINKNQLEIASLSQELSEKTMLYEEIKKMRGKVEEMELMKKYKEEAITAQNRVLELEQELGSTGIKIESLKDDKLKLLREIAQVKREVASEEERAVPRETLLQTSPNNAVEKLSASEAALIKVGHLRIYEIMLGVFFISIILNYIMMA